MKRIFSIIILFSFIGNVFSKPDDFNQQFKSCYRVYFDIINAIGRLDPTAPKIVPRRSSTLTAQITPDGEIHIGDKFIEVCRSMGKDSLNAMALVIGHELAHHYAEHFWVKDYGTAYAELGWGQKIKGTFKDVKELGVYESQADEFGMFFAYVAGYNTLGLAADLYQHIYDAYGLPDTLPGYPSLEERKQIAQLSEERVKQLIHVFETGKLLNILSTVETGQYRQYLLGKASECYEHIINEKFTSREMYNNLGISYMLMAMGLMDDDEIEFSYPVVLDDDSRLYDTEEAGTKGVLGFGNTEEQIEHYLEQAKRYFNHAKELDKHYVPPYINLANVYDLRKEYDDAEYMANKAHKIAQEQEKSKLVASAQEIQGIVLYHINEKGDAIKKLEEAKKNGSKLSDFNLAVMKGQSPDFINNKKLSVFLTAKEERIDNKTMYEVFSETDFYSDNLIKLQGDSRIIKVDKYKANLYVVDCTDRECPWNNVVLYQTKDDYDKPTSKDIYIHDNLDKVLKAYGKPESIVPAANHDYYVFPGSNIIFKISAQDKVEGWTIYYHA